MKHPGLAFAALLTLAVSGHARDDARAPLTVFFADGSSQPLRAWSLSYEYATWPKGESPARGAVSHRESGDLLTGKKVVPTAGLLLELEYAGANARGLATVDKTGKRSGLKTDPPAADVLAPQAGKDAVVQARGLDLLGETLTGGKRSYCLLSYTALFECAAEPPQRVVKIQFP
jgi:hypothetical protein